MALIVILRVGGTSRSFRSLSIDSVGMPTMIRYDLLLRLVGLFLPRNLLSA